MTILQSPRITLMATWFLTLFLGTAQLLAAPILLHHRGGRAFGPENTLAAINLGNQWGGDGFEIDVRGTGDVPPELILMHDDTLDRTTDGTGPVDQMTLAQIQQLDAGSLYGNGSFAGEPVPTLNEALTAIQAYGGQVILDRKSGTTTSKLAEELANLSFPQHDVYLWEPNVNLIAAVLQDLPGAQMIFTLRSEFTDFDTAFLNQLIGLGVKGVSITNPSTQTQAFVDLLHDNGLFAFWRISSASVAFDRHVMALTFGVDVIDTSNPDLYLQALQTLGLPLPFAADFDQNDVVDDADLAIWESAVGVDNMADADFDVESDGHDFFIWQQQFGDSRQPVAPVTTVIPEPSGAVLAFLGMAGIFLSTCAKYRRPSSI